MRERRILLAAAFGMVLSSLNAQTQSTNLKIASCNFEDHHPQKIINQHEVRGYIGNSNSTTDVYNLESRPGAPFTILLDFDGNGSDGKSAYGGFGNNSYTVSGASDAYVKKIWEHMSDDFIAFNVNVTTSHEVFDEYDRSDKIICAFAEFGKPGWKGIAYVGSFGNGNAALVDIDMNPATGDASVDARVGSHEVGHSLGLSHDGGGGDPYYNGHGEYVPIMGSGARDVTHWSIGEFSSANNHEDDVSIIAQTLGYVQDDIDQFRELQYVSNGTIVAEDNTGSITSRADKDLFKFEMASSGAINVTASTSISWSNLDVRLRLLDANKNEIQSVNPVGQRSASISANIPSGGIYYLEIDGDGELSVNTGWSDYSSMGYYEISGNITGLVPIENDAVLNSVSGFGNVCEQAVLPEISVTNKGSNTIDKLNFDLYIDGSFFRTETINANLQSGGTSVYQLDEIKETGDHTIEVRIGIQNQTDQITFNNSVSTDYHLIQGKTFQFATNYNDFNGSNPFTWQVIDQKSGAEITNSQSVELDQTVNTQQDFCLSAGCYQFKMTGDFDPCLSYSPYSSGSYSGGETVARNGYLYKAKWWTNNAPPSAEWEDLGPCPSVNADFKLTDIDDNIEVVNEPSTALNGSYDETFCVELPISISEVEKESFQFKAYPNPSDQVLNIKSSQKMDHLKIIDVTGKTVWSQFISSKQTSVSLLGLSSGIYTVQIDSEGATNSKLILKK